MTERTLNVFEIARLQIKKACGKLNADPAVYEIIKKSNESRFCIISSKNG